LPNRKKRREILPCGGKGFCPDLPTPELAAKASDPVPDWIAITNGSVLVKLIDRRGNEECVAGPRTANPVLGAAECSRILRSPANTSFREQWNRYRKILISVLLLLRHQIPVYRLCPNHIHAARITIFIRTGCLWKPIGSLGFPLLRSSLVAHF
jgi:hypothetical protein